MLLAKKSSTSFRFTVHGDLSTAQTKWRSAFCLSHVCIWSYGGLEQLISSMGAAFGVPNSFSTDVFNILEMRVGRTSDMRE